MASPGDGRRVAVVTDSTASLPPALAASLGIVVVPLHVRIDGVDHREGVDLTPQSLVASLRSGAVVSTSQPSPEAFALAYAQAAADGADEIVSVHLSGRLSGTVDAARLAAAGSAVPVHVVDSRTVGMALGLAVASAAHLAGRASAGDEPDAEVSGAACALAAGRVAVRSSVHFAVDSLDHLRRGGRLGPVAAALGGVLGLRPVLVVAEGALEVAEKVRTSARARERIVELALADAAGRRSFDLAVHHLGQPDLAQMLADRLDASAGPRLRTLHVVEVSAVVGAHVGPGVSAVVVADA
ncbi:MAG: DegV family protein [Cellulomonadaceae bacterium]|nr:DegV family protein [Cellulomonadaceae bacterium]